MVGWCRRPVRALLAVPAAQSLMTAACATHATCGVRGSCSQAVCEGGTVSGFTGVVSGVDVWLEVANGWRKRTGGAVRPRDREWK